MPREGYATRFFLASIHNFWLYLEAKLLSRKDLWQDR